MSEKKQARLAQRLMAAGVPIHDAVAVHAALCKKTYSTLGITEEDVAALRERQAADMMDEDDRRLLGYLNQLVLDTEAIVAMGMTPSHYVYHQQPG